jgi:hypothetical protein
VSNLEWISSRDNVVHGLLVRNTAVGKRASNYKHGRYSKYAPAMNS